MYLKKLNNRCRFRTSPLSKGGGAGGGGVYAGEGNFNIKEYKKKLVFQHLYINWLGCIGYI